MYSSKTFISGWKNACKRYVEKDNRFILVDISLCDKYEIYDNMSKKGYKNIGPLNPIYKFIYVNKDNKIYFSDYIKINLINVIAELKYNDFMNT